MTYLSAYNSSVADDCSMYRLIHSTDDSRIYKKICYELKRGLINGWWHVANMDKCEVSQDTLSDLKLTFTLQ